MKTDNLTHAPAQAISPELYAAGTAAQLLRFGAGDPTHSISDDRFDAMLTAQRRRVVLIARHILAATAELEAVPVKQSNGMEAANG